MALDTVVLASWWPFLDLLRKMRLLNFHNYVLPGWTSLVLLWWTGRPVNRKVGSFFRRLAIYRNVKLL